MIQLADSAVSAVKTALSRSAQPAEGCASWCRRAAAPGLKYMMGLETARREADAVVHQSGVKLFIDKESQPHIAGMKVDFVAGLGASGFVFNNPNAASKCSCCGKSFS